MTYIQPLFTLSLLAILAVLVLRWRTGKLIKPMGPFLAWTVLFLVAWPPTAQFSTRLLEMQYPPRAYPAGDAQAIVVLASGVSAGCPPVAIPTLGTDTFERCQYAAWLHTHWRPLPVVASGGSGDESVPPYASVMREAIEREGVPPSTVWLETESHSTHQSAVNVARMLGRNGIRRIVLVTEGYHMPRAAAAFRKEGLSVIAAGCGYRSYHPYFAQELIPGWESIEWNEDVLHEAVGLAWYRIRGWI